MSFEKTWSGEWHGRIMDRVHRLGFETVTQYVAERPGVSLLVFAKELGRDDVAAAQIRSILVEESIRTRTTPRALRDLFVRELRQSLPAGWKYPLDDASRCDVAGALATWRTELEVEDHLDCFDEERTFKAGQELLNAELPEGWLPEGPDDPVIVAFVDRCLGRAPWLWYLATLLPAIGLVQAGLQAVADRYTYLPLVGLFVAGAWEAALPPRRRRAALLAPVLCLLALGALAAAARAQLGHWRSSVTLFERALAVTRENYIAEFNLGLALEREGRIAVADRHYRNWARIRQAKGKGHP